MICWKYLAGREKEADHVLKYRIDSKTKVYNKGSQFGEEPIVFYISGNCSNGVGKAPGA